LIVKKYLSAAIFETNFVKNFMRRIPANANYRISYGSDPVAQW